MPRTVTIDCFAQGPARHSSDVAIVAVDVIRATTTAITAIARGRECYPVGTLEEAVPLAAALSNPLLVGELGGNMPYGFHVNNSPADIDRREDVQRPMILISTSGTRLICGALEGQAMYVACLRNLSAQIAHLASYGGNVAVIGAGARGEFREEDQLCCAWIAEGLLSAGFDPADGETTRIVERWRGVDVHAIEEGHSATYLRDTGQEKDLDFILSKVDDLDDVYVFDGVTIQTPPVSGKLPVAAKTTMHRALLSAGSG